MDCKGCSAFKRTCLQGRARLNQEKHLVTA